MEEPQKTYKIKIYSKICELVENSHRINAGEIESVFTKDLSVPENYNFVILDQKFSELQKYGEQIYYLKNLIDEQMRYAKFVSKEWKDRIDFAKKYETDKGDFETMYDSYRGAYQEYLAWRFFLGMTKDKWKLLDKATQHIRACTTTLRESMKIDAGLKQT